MRSKHEKIKLFRQLRKLHTQNRKVKGPFEVVVELAKWIESPVELFFVITLDPANRIISVTNTNKGTCDKTMLHPRDIFRRALLDNAKAIIVAHNHPSGQLKPSDEDKAVTENLEGCGKMMGIECLDHVIITYKGYYSIRQCTATYFQHTDIDRKIEGVKQLVSEGKQYYKGFTK